MRVCAVCGREGRWQGHHPTGKDDADVYFDVELTVPLCHDHHRLCHDDWHTLDLAGIDRRLTLIERVELRLRRSAVAWSRIDAGRGGGTLWGKLASAFVVWANDLRRFRLNLDRVTPDWRADPGFYSSEDE